MGPISGRKEQKFKNKALWKQHLSKWPISVSQKDNKIQYIREYRKLIKQEINKQYGSCCYLCSRNSKMAYHNIKGRDHKGYLSPKLINEYRPLCYQCHAVLHFIVRCMNKTKIIELMEELFNGFSERT